MGLTIHYTLQSDAPTAREARRLVERLHQAASGLPLAELSDVVEFSDDEGSLEDRVGDDNLAWLLTQADFWLIRDDACACVRPLHVIAFASVPGAGSESANFGLCRYPATIEVNGRWISTGLSGWNWRSFCKTQYASNPDDGGLENFVRSHRAVISLLDRARELNLLREVQDESGYWESRNVASITNVVGQWNRQLAGFVGRIKDGSDAAIVAPITGYPDFEHLEADGRGDELDR